ncbi:hypothetical protein OH492_18080 [Vibrio chagasii]|nr:hypothetical protein [Vibrio chagasii]
MLDVEGWRRALRARSSGMLAALTNAADVDNFDVIAPLIAKLQVELNETYDEASSINVWNFVLGPRWR